MKENFFKAADGTNIYYSISGKEGGLPLIMCDGLGCDGFVWKYMLDYFTKTNTIVRWHYRGHGKSDTPTDLSTLTIAHLCEDLKAILDKEKIAPGVVFGHSMGVQLILEFYKRYPKSVAGLIPICGSYGRPADTFFNTSLMYFLLPYLQILSKTFSTATRFVWKRLILSNIAYHVSLRVELHKDLINFDDFFPYLWHLGNMDPVIFIETLKYASEHTTEDFLPRIQAPTLIIAAEKDNFTPMWLSEKMNRDIPDSEFLMIKGASHAAPIEIPELVNLRIEKFIRERVLSPHPST